MKKLPCNVDAERFVIGSILLDGEYFTQTVGVLQPEDFSLEKHRRIFKRMGELYERGERIDRVTVANELMKFGELESCDGLSYLTSLDDGIPQIPNLDGYIGIVKEKSTLRRIMFSLEHLTNRAQSEVESSDDILASLAETAIDLRAASVIDNRPVSTAEMIEKHGVDSLLAPRAHGGIRLPWHRLDAALSGLTGGQMIVIMAETSRGKTSLALQIATCAAIQGFVPDIWTMEMSNRAMFKRIVTQLSGVSPDITRPTFQERTGQNQAVCTIADHPLFFDNRSRNVQSFVANCRHVRSRKGLGLGVVDYLQLIRGGGATRSQQVSDNSRALKLAAMDLDIPLIVLSQVDRASVKGEGKIGLHSAKESGDIENDADVVLWPDCPMALSKDQDTTVSMNIGKQREGPAGFSIPMLFRPKSQTFMELEDAPSYD